MVRRNKRAGFMLRDLIACLVMFLVGLMLLLPGCSSKAPEEGMMGDDGGGEPPDPPLPPRRALGETKDKLRQMGIAVHNFEATFKKLPPAYASASIAGNKGVVGYGVPPGEGRLTAPQTIHVHLLPYIEQAALYN